MRTDQRILATLPDTFTRQMLLQATSDAGYSLSKASQIIEQGTISGEIIRIKPGNFKKNTN